MLVHLPGIFIDAQIQLTGGVFNKYCLKRYECNVRLIIRALSRLPGFVG